MLNPILYPKAPFAEFKSDDLDLGLKVRYVGSSASATVTVSSAGDITFKQGVAGSEVVDATIDSGDATGATSDEGVIDVSDDSSMTFGEVVDLINASANWEAYLVGVLRADSADASTGSLLARSETTISQNGEVPLYKDTSKVLNLTIRVGRRINVNGSEAKSAAEIYEIVSTNTFGSGTSKYQIYLIDEETKTETKLFEKATAATGVEGSEDFVVNGRGSLGTQKQGQHLLVRLIGSAVCTGNIMVIGATASGQ
jgi:hypothetical protein